MVCTGDHNHPDRAGVVVSRGNDYLAQLLCGRHGRALELDAFTGPPEHGLQAILDRGYGKPVQSIDASITEDVDRSGFTRKCQSLA
jgi:hypothetical protein